MDEVGSGAGAEPIANGSGSLATAGELRPGEPEAIFVVGVARSGTTLLRQLLQTSPRIGIAPENHFVGHLTKRLAMRSLIRSIGDMNDDATVRRFVGMVYSGELQKRSRWRRLSPFWRWVPENVPQVEFERRLLATDRSDREFMAAFMRVFSDTVGRPVMGEKTPAHLGYVETLLEWFPGGRVIHTFRDPRAIYVSDRHRRRTKNLPPYSWLGKIPLVMEAALLLQTVWQWRFAIRRHQQLKRKYPGKYLLVKFEDVVTKPDETLPAVFHFVGVEVPDFRRVEVATRHGMRPTAEGLDPEAVNRWRSRIHPVAKRFLELALGGPMRRFGYTE